MMKNKRGVCAAAFSIGLALMLFPSPAVQAGGTVKIDDTKWVSVGAGLRTSFNSVEDAAPSKKDRSKDFLLDDIRLYVNGQIHENITFEFNTQAPGDDTISILDAVAKFEFNDLFNIWAGRFLPPSDRSNLSGPYFLNAWDFPIAQLYPNISAGRDDGAAIWGQTGGGQFKYQVGVFQGITTGQVLLDPDGTPSTGDEIVGDNDEQNLLYAGRLVYNVWDPEPGYYNSSTYYGSKEVLAVGAVIMTQSDALGTVATPGDFTGWNIDVLAEKNLEGVGVVTLEGAFYDYDRDDVAADSDGYFVLASLLLPQKMGMGQWQPMVRYQELDTEGIADSTTRFDIGLNYIVDGHNARISLLYGDVDRDPSVGADYNLFRIGVQLQL